MATATSTADDNLDPWTMKGLKLLRRYKRGQMFDFAALQARLMKSGLEAPSSQYRWGAFVTVARRQGLIAPTGNTVTVEGRRVREYELT